MCLGIPAQIVEIVDAENHLARVDVNGVRRVISVRLLEQEMPAPQGWVLVHVGFAMANIDEEEARLTVEAMEKLGEAYRDEMAAFDSSAIQ